MDTAIRISNAQYEDPIILKTLDVKLLLTSGDDYGWDILQLQYSIDGPLETVCIQKINLKAVVFRKISLKLKNKFIVS